MVLLGAVRQQDRVSKYSLRLFT